jgi:hypothetical protein
VLWQSIGWNENGFGEDTLGNIEQSGAIKAN